MTTTSAAVRPKGGWHAETVDRVLAELAARPQGLTT
jgi:hypothetical protein